MDIVKLNAENLPEAIFRQLVDLENNCGLTPYSPAMLMACITMMDTYACMDEDRVAGFITVHWDLYLGGGVYIANLNVAKENESLDGGQVASGVSKAPDCRQPKIKNVDIKGDKVYLTVENLPGFMRVQGGKDVKTFDTTGFATATDGESGEVILVAPKKGASGFYKVIRN